MRHRYPSLAIAMAMTFVMAGSSFGDELTDEMTSNPAMMSTIQLLGATAFYGRTPADEAKNKAQLKTNYWAFKPDVHLTDAQVASETKHFDAIWASLMRVSLDYDITQISFVGCDSNLLSKCLDLYFAAVTPRGPVILKMSIEIRVGDMARLFGVETYTNWDKVKEIVRGIQHPVSPTRVPTITFHPKDVKDSEAGGHKT